MYKSGIYLYESNNGYITIQDKGTCSD